MPLVMRDGVYMNMCIARTLEGESAQGSVRGIGENILPSLQQLANHWETHLYIPQQWMAIIHLYKRKRLLPNNIGLDVKTASTDNSYYVSSSVKPILGYASWLTKGRTSPFMRPTSCFWQQFGEEFLLSTSLLPLLPLLWNGKWRGQRK